MYIVSKYNIYLYELCKQEEKRVFVKSSTGPTYRPHSAMLNPHRIVEGKMDELCN